MTTRGQDILITATTNTRQLYHTVLKGSLLTVEGYGIVETQRGRAGRVWYLAINGVFLLMDGD